MTVADELVRAARGYIGRGLRVIALTGKAPNGQVHPHWRDDALCFESSGQEVWDAFTHDKTTGVGILTGYPYYVVDIDAEEGAVAWKEIAGEDFIPDRWVARTGRRDENGQPNGLHVWFAHWEHFPPAKFGPKLDFKGEGGYVAAPPSIHPDSGERYEWLLEPGANIPLEMPDGLLALLHRRQTEAEARSFDKRIVKQRMPAGLIDGRLYPVATFDGIIQKVRDEPEGNRNGVLYWATRTMLEEGADEEDLEELLDAAIASGLARRESRRTIRSAYEAGRG